MEHVSNEEKAKEIAMPCQGCECEWTKEKMYKQQYCKDCVAQDKFIAAIEAIKWKDKQHEQEKQQWIERVLTILTNWAKKHTKECDGDKFMRMGLTNDLVIYFKKAMKGEYQLWNKS